MGGISAEKMEYSSEECNFLKGILIFPAKAPTKTEGVIYWCDPLSGHIEGEVTGRGHAVSEDGWGSGGLPLTQGSICASVGDRRWIQSTTVYTHTHTVALIKAKIKELPGRNWIASSSSICWPWSCAAIWRLSPAPLHGSLPSPSLQDLRFIASRLAKRVSSKLLTQSLMEAIKNDEMVA